MASPTLVVDPSDTACRKNRRATYELHGVAANGSTICVCMLCITCILYYVCLKIVEELWVEVGLIKSIPYHLLLTFISVT